MVRINNDVSGILSREPLTRRLLEIVYPLTIYYAAVMMAMVVLRAFFGLTEENYVIIQLLGSLVVLPIIYFGFYRRDGERFGTALFVNYVRQPRLFAVTSAVAILMAVLLGTGLNNIIAMSPLPGMSPGYSRAADHFYGSTLGVELLSSGLVTPILEELLYRGVIYGRLRQMPPRDRSKLPVIIISALIFAVIHFNIVQFVYAFCLGLALAFIMEWTGHVCWPTIIHIAANSFAVIRTELGFWKSGTDGSAGAWVFSVLLTVAGCGIVLLFKKLGEKIIVFTKI